MLLTTLYVAYWAGQCIGNWNALGDIHVGYYAWLLSFGLVAAGMLHLAIRPSLSAAASVTPNVVRTPEELRAIRELEDFLRVIGRAPEREGESPA